MPSQKNTSSERITMNGGNTCLELTPDFRERRQLVARVCRSAEFCLGHGCVTKCCAEGEYYSKSRCTKIQAMETVMDFYEEISNLTMKPWNGTGWSVNDASSMNVRVVFQGMRWYFTVLV